MKDSTVLEKGLITTLIPDALCLVDQVKISGAKVEAYFTVLPEMPYFQHHFGEGKEIQPGVLNVWALVQASQLGLYARFGRMLVLDRLREVEFLAPVLPGDVLRLEIELGPDLSEGAGYVGEQKVVSGKIGFRADPTRTAPNVSRFLSIPARAISIADVASLIPHGDGFRFVGSGFVEAGERASGVYRDADEFYYLKREDCLELCQCIGIEAMAQMGATSLLSVPENCGKVPVLTGISRADFFTPVNRGDGLRFEVSIGDSTGKGIGFVNNQPVFSGEISFQLQDESRLERLLAIVRKKRAVAAA